MHADLVTIPAGAHGLDFAFWRPGDEVAAWSFVVRYICKRPNPKAVTRAEIDFYHSIGVAVILTFEQGADDWQDGAGRGTEHGQIAAQFAADLGYPKGAPVLPAFDTNAAPGDPRATAYGNAFADQVIPQGWDFGPYADLDVIRLLAARSGLNWLAGATSWSDPTKPYQPETMPDYELVHVRQVISGSTPSYDQNIVLRPFKAWLPHEAPDVEVVTPPSDQKEAAGMADVLTNADANGAEGAYVTKWLLREDGTKLHITEPFWAALGSPVGAALPMSVIDQIPDYVASTPVESVLAEAAPIHFTVTSTVTQA
jgi:hypothetical protein